MGNHVLLVIDDEESMRDAFQMALEDFDCEVETATDGHEGLAMAKAGKYDLIFLDFKMPKCNGAQVLVRIREINKDIPIYIVTAYEKDFVIEINLMMGTDNHLRYELLHKPIDDEKIVEITKRALKLI
jgi:CheY-like chemotaxis protein